MYNKRTPNAEDAQLRTDVSKKTDPQEEKKEKSQRNRRQDNRKQDLTIGCIQKHKGWLVPLWKQKINVPFKMSIRKVAKDPACFQKIVMRQPLLITQETEKPSACKKENFLREKTTRMAK